MWPLSKQPDENMIDLSPKSQFRLITPDHFKAFGDLIVHPSMRLGMNVALTQLTHSGITTEELNGAKKYMNLLADLTNTDKPKRLPQKSLQQD